MTTHLLVVGEPGECGELLRGPGRAGRLTVLSPMTGLPAPRTLRHTDTLLALDDSDSDRALRHLHGRHPITHVAAFAAEFADHAAGIAEELNTALYPDFVRTSPGNPRVAGKRRQGTESRSAIVAIFAERGDIQPLIIERRVDAGTGAPTAYVAPDIDIDAELRAEFLLCAGAAIRACGLRTGVATVLVRKIADAAAYPAETTVALPRPMVCALIREATGLDIADLVARQATGHRVSDRVRTQLTAPPRRGCCARLVYGPPGAIRIAHIDRAEALGTAIHIVSEPPAGSTAPVRAVVWARDETAGGALRTASRAAHHLVVRGEEDVR